MSPDTRPSAGNTGLDTAHSSKSTVFYLVVLFSGVAGLGYQMVWSRMLSVSLGHETVAVIAVVSAFFVGMMVGALAFGRLIRKSGFPHYWFVGLEWTIALWALALVFLVPHYNLVMPGLIGVEPATLRHWGVAFSGSLLLLLPATAAMGATLPAMERIMAGIWRKPDRVAGLYATNTFGAVIGTLAATFYLTPHFGLTTTLLLLAVTNFACGAVVLLLCARAGAATVAVPQVLIVTAKCSLTGISATRLRLTLFFTGLLGIGYEIIVIRVLSQVLENTVYSFAAVLTVYLVGTALGSAIYQRSWARQNFDTVQWQRRLGTLLVLTCTACLGGLMALWFSNIVYMSLWQGLGQGFVPAVVGELGAAALVLVVPTIAMGALFGHLAQRATQAVGLGVAIGLNTLGCALAPVLVGMVTFPLIGAKAVLVIISVSYLLLMPVSRAALNRWAMLPAGLAILLILSPIHLRFVDMQESDRVVHYREGVMATLAVVEDANQDRFLKVNNHFTMGGTASRYSDHRQTHIPLLLHGGPRSVLYLGVGTGITLDAARYHAQVEVVGVELIPESLSLIPHFGVDLSAGQWAHPPRLIAADARRYVVASDRKFDVIIGEIFHPARDGAGSLYTVEHFTAVKNRLTDNGSFCQWLPLFQLDLPSLKTIVRTFVHVFPDARLHLGHYSTQQPILCLEGSAEPRIYPENYLLNRVRAPALQNELVQMRLNSDFALFGGYLGGGEALGHFAGPGPLNTDDHLLVTYQAPMLAYASDEPPVLRLASILNSLADTRQSIVAPGFQSRMQGYWQARDRYLLAAVEMEQSDPEGWTGNLVSHLLDVVRISGDFEPAYFTLLSLAQELYARDPRASYQLLEDLRVASPGHPEALALRNRLFGQ